MIRRIRRARCAPPPMMLFVFSRSVPSNLTLGTFLGCIPQRSSAAVSQGARYALLRRRYDALELHIECLLLQVNDAPPLTDTRLRTVCKNARQPLSSDAHEYLTVASAETAPCSSQDAGSASQCVSFVCKKEARVQSLPTNLWTLHEREDLSEILSHIKTHRIHIIDVQVRCTILCQSLNALHFEHRVFISEHVAVHSKTFIDILSSLPTMPSVRQTPPASQCSFPEMDQTRHHRRSLLSIVFDATVAFVSFTRCCRLQIIVERLVCCRDTPALP